MGSEMCIRDSSHTQVLSDENAFLAEPDPQSLADSILQAFKSKEQSGKVAARAKKLVEERYSRESFNRRLKKMYEELLVS